MPYDATYYADADRRPASNAADLSELVRSVGGLSQDLSATVNQFMDQAASLRDGDFYREMDRLQRSVKG